MKDRSNDPSHHEQTLYHRTISHTLQVQWLIVHGNEWLKFIHCHQILLWVIANTGLSLVTDPNNITLVFDNKTTSSDDKTIFPNLVNSFKKNGKHV